MTVFEDWDAWKKTMAKAVQEGKELGMSQQELAGQAERIGDFLSNQVDPQNPQQRVLQELWRSADEKEQQALASAIVKMVQQ